MAFLVIAGTEVQVIDQGFAERERESMGSDRRMFDGTLRSSRRTSKRVWQGTAYFATEAALTALRLALGAVGSTVTVEGDAIGAAAIDAKVTLGQADYENVGGTGWYRTCAFVIREA